MRARGRALDRGLSGAPGHARIAHRRRLGRGEAGDSRADRRDSRVAGAGGRRLDVDRADSATRCGRGARGRPNAQPRVPAGGADFCLLLADRQDPGNVGAILRSAAAAGVGQVFLSPHCAFAWSPKVLRAGQGAHFHLEIFEDVDLVAWVRDYRGTLVAAVTSGGESLFTADLAGPVAVAIGNEGAGLSESLRAAAQGRVSIPMPGGFESLNAAAAAAICLFECVRRLAVRPA